MRGDSAQRAYDPHVGVNFWDSQTILDHPRFPHARSVYLERVLNLYGSDVFLNKLLMEGVRIVIFSASICMAAGYRVEDRDTWPTIGNLKRALAQFGLASPRRIDHVVARLIQTNYLESQVSPLDRRVRLLLPTDKMIEHDQNWLVAHYAPLAALFGEEDYALVLGGDPEFQKVQRRIATDFFTRSAMVLLRNPDIMLFLARDGGIFVLIELAKEMADRASSTVDLSLTRLGRRFSISRTHVRQLLQAAEAQGLVEILQSERLIVLKPRLIESLDRFIADGMANHDLTGAAAMREIRSR